MSIFWSLLWGCVMFAGMTVCMQRHLPKLAHQQSVDMETSSEQSVAQTAVKDETQTAPRAKNLLPRQIAVLVVCTLLACLCGFFVAHAADTPNSILKLLLAYVVLGCVSVCDLELMIIPNVYVLLLLIGRGVMLVPELIFTYEGVWSRLLSSVVGAVVCLLSLLLVVFFTRGGLGFGDVKLLVGLGFLCGLYAALFALVFGCFLSAVVSAILLFSKKKTMKDALPLAPFVLAGYTVTLLLGLY